MAAMIDTDTREAASVLDSIISQSIGPEECAICSESVRWNDHLVNVHEGQVREIRRRNELTGVEEVIPVNRLPHYFHEACFVPWLSDYHQIECPSCRTRISSEVIARYPLHAGTLLLQIQFISPEELQDPAFFEDIQVLMIAQNPASDV